MPDTIVIGTGISATAYLATVAGPMRDTEVLGGQDLWRRMAPDHRMGQQPALLMGNVLQGPRYFGATPTPDSRSFLTAGRFADLLDQELRRSHAVHIPDSLVTKVSSHPESGYVVAGAIDGRPFAKRCAHVVMALGPGPSRELTQVPVDGGTAAVGSFGGRVVGGTDFLSPLWQPPADIEGVPIVAVYGGSATAAWAVEQACMRDHYVVKWFTRPGGSEFNEAFPPGNRNDAVERRTEFVRELATLIHVERTDWYGAASPLLLTLEDKDKVRSLVAVDILVFALGSTHLKTRGGIPTIVDAPLHEQLFAYYDHNRTISDAACLLAIGTADRSLMIVGSSMHSQAGFPALNGMSILTPRHQNALHMLSSYAEINQTLPPAARPPEGIAMVMVGIEALNDYMPVTPTTRVANEFDLAWNINFNTSNRNQIAAFLAHKSDLEPFAADLAVVLIVWLRSIITLGLSRPQVGIIIGLAEYWERRFREVNPDMDATRCAMQKNFRQDLYLDIHVRRLTTGVRAQRMWQRLGIDFPVVTI